MLQGQQALVIGLAREGIDLTNFLVEHGAHVLVTDRKSEAELAQMRRTSWLVMELSSFQLEPLQVSPHVALITNLTPNHLDRHPDMEAYWAAKGQILAHQQPHDVAVLNADDRWVQRYQPRAR